MNKDKAHDVLHVWNGDRAQDCPVCNGTLKSDEEIIAAAKEVAADNYYPRINPNLTTALYCDENGKPIEQPKDKAIKTGEDTVEDKKPATPKVMTETPSFMTEVLSFSDSGSTELPKKIKIIPTGTFKTQAYGDVEITKESLLEMAKNFTDKVRAGVPIDIDHDQKAAAGWITDVEVFGDGMYADVEWTKLGEDKLGTKEYRFFSPEFAQSYIDPEHSHELSNVLIAGSLVNRPMFKELPAIAGSEDGIDKNLTKNNAPLTIVISNSSQTRPNDATVNQNDTLLASEKEVQPMELQAVLAKEKSARTSEEQGFVYSNLAQLTDEQKIAEGFVTNPVTASEPKVEVPAAPAVETPVIAASETGNIAASEVETLKTRLAAAEAKAQEGSMAFSELQESKKELQKIKFTNEVKALTFSEKGGKIAPAQVTPIVDLMMTMSEPQRVELTKIIESLPDRKIYGEMGSDVDLDKSKATDQLTAKAHELVKEKKEQGIVMVFGEAMRQVVQENPDLYQESLKKANTN